MPMSSSSILHERKRKREKEKLNQRKEKIKKNKKQIKIIKSAKVFTIWKDLNLKQHPSDLSSLLLFFCFLISLHSISLFVCCLIWKREGTYCVGHFIGWCHDNQWNFYHSSNVLTLYKQTNHQYTPSSFLLLSFTFTFSLNNKIEKREQKNNKINRKKNEKRKRKRKERERGREPFLS